MDAQSEQKLQHDLTIVSDKWEVRETIKKGRGVFALTKILKGTLIMDEDPVIHFSTDNYIPSDIQLAFENLTQDLRDKYWDLASFHTMRKVKAPQRLDSAPDDSPSRIRFINMLKARAANKKSVQSIFYANSVSTAPGAAVFLTMSRINHSCLPNASYYWDRQLSRIQVRVTRDIFPGEEITISYIDACYTPESRKIILRNSYGFACDCRACNYNEADNFFAESRDRRYFMEYVQARVYDFEPQKEIPDYERLIEGFEEEGLVLPYTGSAYKRLAELYQKSTRHTHKAIPTLEKAIDILMVCSGPNATMSIEAGKALTRMRDEMMERSSSETSQSAESVECDA